MLFLLYIIPLFLLSFIVPYLMVNFHIALRLGIVEMRQLFVLLLIAFVPLVNIVFLVTITFVLLKMKM